MYLIMLKRGVLYRRLSLGSGVCVCVWWWGGGGGGGGAEGNSVSCINTNIWVIDKVLCYGKEFVMPQCARAHGSTNVVAIPLNNLAVK